jgi:hypothetical protein
MLIREDHRHTGMDLRHKLIRLVSDNRASAQPFSGFGIFRSFQFSREPGKSQRASVFHGDRERQLRLSRFAPFVKSIRRNQAAPFWRRPAGTTGLCSSNSFDCFRPESVYFAFWVIDTATNKVVAASPGKGIVSGIAFSPDGKTAYFANWDPYLLLPQVLVFDNGSTISLPPYGGDNAITITPDGRFYVPYVLFNETNIELGRKPSRDAFHLESSLILSGAANDEIHPDTEPVKLQVGPFIATIPAGSFRQHGDSSYRFEGVIDDVRLEARIEQTGSLRYRFSAEAKGANLSGITNPVQVSLGIGDDVGLTSVNAHFEPDHHASDDWIDHWH